MITIPGISTCTADVIIAGTGAGIARFPIAGRLALWAGSFQQVELTETCALRDSTRKREKSSSNRLGHEWPFALKSEHINPAHQVVHNRGKDGPGTIGTEVSRLAVLETRTFLQIPDGDLVYGVAAVTGVGADRITVTVVNECVVTKGGRQLGLNVEYSKLSLHNEFDNFRKVQ